MEKFKTIVLASDHGGFNLKEIIKKHLIENSYTVIDIGVDEPKSVDYPDYGKKAAGMVSRGEAEIGILLCGTGLGMSMVANKIKGIRAALCHNIFTAQMARAHNNANILVLGARVLGDELAVATLDAFLKTPFEGGRHQRRIDKISACDFNSET